MRGSDELTANLNVIVVKRRTNVALIRSLLSDCSIEKDANDILVMKNWEEQETVKYHNVNGPKDVKRNRRHVGVSAFTCRDMKMRSRITDQHAGERRRSGWLRQTSQLVGRFSQLTCNGLAVAWFSSMNKSLQYQQALYCAHLNPTSTIRTTSLNIVKNTCVERCHSIVKKTHLLVVSVKTM